MTKCVLEDVLRTVVLKTGNTLRKRSVKEFTAKEDIVCRVPIFLNIVLHQIYFSGIYKICNTTNRSNLDC